MYTSGVQNYINTLLSEIKQLKKRIKQLEEERGNEDE